jgi:hypothetical protein
LFYFRYSTLCQHIKRCRPLLSGATARIVKTLWLIVLYATWLADARTRAGTAPAARFSLTWPYTKIKHTELASVTEWRQIRANRTVLHVTDGAEPYDVSWRNDVP